MEAGTSQKLLDRFDISTNDLSALKECGHMLGEATIERVVDQFYEWLPQQPEFNLFFNSKELLEHVKKQQKVYWVDFFKGVVDQRYIDYRVHIGEVHARRDHPASLPISYRLVSRLERFAPRSIWSKRCLKSIPRATYEPNNRQTI